MTRPNGPLWPVPVVVAWSGYATPHGVHRGRVDEPCAMVGIVDHEGVVVREGGAIQVVPLEIVRVVSSLVEDAIDAAATALRPGVAS